MVPGRPIDRLQIDNPPHASGHARLAYVSSIRRARHPTICLLLHARSRLLRFGSRTEFAPDVLPLGVIEFQPPLPQRLQLISAPVRLHDAARHVARTQQKVAQFMRQHASQQLIGVDLVPLRQFLNSLEIGIGQVAFLALFIHERFAHGVERGVAGRLGGACRFAAGR